MGQQLRRDGSAHYRVVAVVTAAYLRRHWTEIFRQGFDQGGKYCPINIKCRELAADQEARATRPLRFLAVCQNSNNLSRSGGRRQGGRGRVAIFRAEGEHPLACFVGGIWVVDR